MGDSIVWRHREMPSCVIIRPIKQPDALHSPAIACHPCIASCPAAAPASDLTRVIIGISPEWHVMKPHSLISKGQTP